ncbi:sulfatase-like hydrolase/transferase [Chitinophaga sp.]|uniref:sulfatase-like hydrolase/transferase n=1 Tax=Chitinophaga sp. TaxID=1869181 RepID=UPI002F937DE3
MRFNYSLLFLFATITGQAYSQTKHPVTQQKPNIIFILTDDLGYGDVGIFWQNKRAKENNRSKPFAYTPNLDKMAAEGAVLMNSYAAAPVCAPSRSSILTGLSQGHARVRDNQFDKDLADNYTLGNVMQKAGYATAAIGKWGLQGDEKWSADGGKWPAHPLNRGFDYYYGYMRHSDGHEHYPKEGLYRKPKEVWENRTEISKDLDKCYTADLWTAVTKKWIIEHKKGKKAAQPFFIFLAFDTPHAVLELPTCPYPAGGGLTGGVQWRGKPGNMINTASGTIDSYTHPDYATATYDDDNNPATPEVPWPDTYKRYAASTRRIDDAIGDILKLLADLKIDDNTLVIFSSDNGPSIESYLPKPQVPYAANFFGSAGPFDGIKRDALEGGERMPVIARWPGHIPAKNIVTTPSISYDWLPTFTDAAHMPAPVNTDGVSMLPALTGKSIQKEGLIYVEYFESGKSPNYKEFAAVNRLKQRNQMQMIRVGDFVGLRYNIKSADDDFGIFNVARDTHQENNLAASMPELQAMMKAKVLQVRRTDTSARRPYDDALIPAVKLTNASPGLVWRAFDGKFPWIPDVTTLTAAATGKCFTPNLHHVPAGHQTYVFEGYINVPKDGEYTFFMRADTKAFLRIHEATIIDEDYGYAGGVTKEASVFLKAGLHPVKIYYAGNPGATSDLSLEWKSGEFAKTEIPANAFYK